MNSIITDNSNAEHAISSKIDTFFVDFSIGKIMKKSNFYKEGGIQCVVVLKEIFGLVFSGNRLFLLKTILTLPPSTVPVASVPAHVPVGPSLQ